MDEAADEIERLRAEVEAGVDRLLAENKRLESSFIHNQRRSIAGELDEMSRAATETGLAVLLAAGGLH